MKLIPLTQGKYTQVSDNRFDNINQYKWSLSKSQSGKEYAVHNFWDGKNNLVSMHVFIMQPPAGMEVDHWDGDGLNNLDDNLRVCTKAQNMRNRKKPNINKYPYVGIHPIGRKWRAVIGHDGTVTHLGMYWTPELAAQAYDKAALEFFGEYAHLNFPDGKLPDIKHGAGLQRLIDHPDIR